MFYIFILWTTSREDLENVEASLWTPNHLVPIVKGNRMNDTPKVGEFLRLTFKIGRRNVTYHAVVTRPPPEILLKDEEFYVTFMKQQGDYFVFHFNPHPDCSVVSCSEALVEKCLPPTMDQRNRYYFS